MNSERERNSNPESKAVRSHDRLREAERRTRENWRTNHGDAQRTHHADTGRTNHGDTRHETENRERRSEFRQGFRNNKLEGCRREEKVERRLNRQYLDRDGYKVLRERVLMNREHRAVPDPLTHSTRRVDLVVVRDGQAIRSVEVTSLAARKKDQIEKEDRVREHGGVWIAQDEPGDPLVSVRAVPTTIDREV